MRELNVTERIESKVGGTAIKDVVGTELIIEAIGIVKDVENGITGEKCDMTVLVDNNGEVYTTLSPFFLTAVSDLGDEITDYEAEGHDVKAVKLVPVFKKAKNEFLSLSFKGFVE